MWEGKELVAHLLSPLPLGCGRVWEGAGQGAVLRQACVGGRTCAWKVDVGEAGVAVAAGVPSTCGLL